ncbi:MAG: hypothetical protein HUJ53_00970 [Holdemanella sp.]|nr:hypothetical protein [Holdemanella sp.]
MKQRMIYSTCPHCGHVFQMKRDTMSIAGMNAIIDERIMNGTHFTHICSKCKEPYYLMHPFLYRNTEKKYTVVLTHQKHVDNLPEQDKVVLCKTVSQFLFVIKVMEQQLNLKIVLSYKKQLEKKYNCLIDFDKYDDKNQCLWFIIHNEHVAVLLKNEHKNEIYDIIADGV